MNDSTNPKDRLGKLKPQLHLIPAAANIHESMAMGDGASKYGPYNWRDKTVAASIYVGACKRHLDAWFDREENARDSGVHHLGHARACLGILLDAQSLGQMVDDRPKPGAASDLIEQFTKAKPDVNRNDHENVGFHVGPLPQGVYPIYVSRHDDFNDPATWQQETETETVAAINGSGNCEVTGDYEYDEARAIIADDRRESIIDFMTKVLPAIMQAGSYLSDAELPIARPVEISDILADILQTLAVKGGVISQILGAISCTDVGVLHRSYVYIAGPMRGYDLYNFPAFDAARDRFTKEGYVVVSPADIDRVADGKGVTSQPVQDSKVYAYRDFFTLLMLAYTGKGCIAMLPGWEKSVGGVAEFFLARWLNLRILDAVNMQSLNLSTIKWDDIILTVQQYLSKQLTK